MIAGHKDEKQLIDTLLSTTDDNQTNRIRNELITFYEANYHDEIVRIIKSKYILSSEDKSEAAYDLYSSAMEIFINNVNAGKGIRSDFNYRAYILGIARNLFLEKNRKNKEVLVENTPEYANALDEELLSGNPFGSEIEQKKVEEALVKYYLENDLLDCIKILMNSWKKDLKNQEVAALLNIKNPSSKDASRTVTVIQQNCIKRAWRNVPILEELREKYNIKRRKRHEWKKSHD